MIFEFLFHLHLFQNSNVKFIVYYSVKLRESQRKLAQLKSEVDSRSWLKKSVVSQKLAEESFVLHPTGRPFSFCQGAQITDVGVDVDDSNIYKIKLRSRNSQFLF